MPQWEKITPDWEQWSEDFPSGAILRAYRHPEGYEYAPNFEMMQGGWVIVYPPNDTQYMHHAEKHCFPRECGWLEIECVMHEMRAKYGGS